MSATFGPKSPRRSVYSTIEETASKVLKSLRPKKISISFFKSSVASTPNNTFRESFHYEKVSVPNSPRLNSTFLLKNTLNLPNKGLKSRIKRLPPPNFMKVSRESCRRPIQDMRSPVSGRRLRNFSSGS